MALMIEDTYQLTWASWVEIPNPWFHGLSSNQFICDRVSLYPPPPGIICVNSIELQKQLAWRLTASDALQGRPPAYEVRNIFDFKGDYFEKSLVGARVLLLKPHIFSSAAEIVDAESGAMLGYAQEQWIDREKVARVSRITILNGELVAYGIFFPQPLTPEQVTMANQTQPFSDMAKTPGDGSSPLIGPHYSRAEAWRMFTDWYKKK